MKLYFSEKLLNILNKFLNEEQMDTLINNDYDLNCNYFDFASNDKCKISYINKDRFERFENGFWKLEDRVKYAVKSNPSKIFSKLFDEKIGIQINALFSFYNEDSNYEFKIVKGEDIRRYYDRAKYEENTGSLNSSCMKYIDCQKFFDMYVEQEEISMLIRINKNTDLICGRAILWSLPDNEKFLDRIYGNDEIVELFKIYAKLNNFIYRQSQSYENKVDVIKNNEIIKDFCVKIQLKKKYSYFPYMDTVRYLYQDLNIISNNYPLDGYFYLLNDTNGSYNAYEEEEEEIIPDCICNECGRELFSYNDSWWQDVDGNYFCEDCLERCYVRIESNGEYYHIDDVRIYVCEYGDSPYVLESECSSCNNLDCHNNPNYKEIDED